MTDSESDVQRLWREQPREGPAISIAEIRARAQRFDERVRGWTVTGGVLFAVIVVVELIQISFERDLLERLGDLLTVAAFVYVGAQFHRHVPGAAPAHAGTTSSVEFYREQLARHRDMALRPWVFLVPFIPGVGLSLFGRALERSPETNVAIALLAVALFVSVAWVQRRTGRQLAREFDDLG